MFCKLLRKKNCRRGSLDQNKGVSVLRLHRLAPARTIFINGFIVDFLVKTSQGQSTRPRHFLFLNIAANVISHNVVREISLQAKYFFVISFHSVNTRIIFCHFRYYAIKKTHCMCICVYNSVSQSAVNISNIRCLNNFDGQLSVI